jgi:hypothetical protein
MGMPLTLAATATSGLTVSFTTTTTSVCTVSGTTATFLTTGTCSITASQAGNATYAGATSVTQSFTVNAALTSQTIDFTSTASQTVGTPLSLVATATSGLTVSFASSTTSVCTVSGTTATFLTAGTCSITASQAGNATYAAAAPVTQSFTVNAAGLTAQTITFANPGTQTVGTQLALVAAASSGLPVSFTSTTTSVCAVSGTTATFPTAGTCSITASQAGNATYAAATPVPQSFQVTATTGGNTVGYSSCPAPVGSGVTYTIGMLNSSGQPSGPQTIATFTQWNNLKPGDVVCIYGKSAPYAERLVLTQSGSDDQHRIRIVGVIQNGFEPILTGKSATTANAFNYGDEISQYYEGGEVAVTGLNYGTPVAYLNIEGLTIQGATTAEVGGTVASPTYSNNTYSDPNINGGAQSPWGCGSAGINLIRSDHISIIHNRIKDNDNGIFVNSNNGNTSSNVLVEYNHIYGNGVFGEQQGAWNPGQCGADAHGTYSEAENITYLGNRFGALRQGEAVNLLKDRSSGLVVAYNLFLPDGVLEASLGDELLVGSAPGPIGHLLDLVESYDTSVGPPGGFAALGAVYDNVSVFGNIFFDDGAATDGSQGSENAVHFGGDQGNSAVYRKHLHYYNNTVVVRRADGVGWLEMEPTTDAGAWNNIFYAAYVGSSTQPAFNLLSTWCYDKQYGYPCGTVNYLSQNWNSPIWATTGVNGTDSTPSFVNLASNDVHIATDDPTIVGNGQAGDSNYPANSTTIPIEYADFLSTIPRPFSQAKIDLGALGYSAGALLSQTITFNNPGMQTVGTPLALVATASSGLTVSFASNTTSVCTVNGTTATLLTSGTCSITASQPGNATYAAATPVSQSFMVNSGSGAYYTLPAERTTLWQPGVTYNGGIPTNRTQCGATVAASGDTTGVTDQANIQTAINDCTAGHFVLLGPGTFYIQVPSGSNGGVYIEQSNITLRGSGAGTTVLDQVGSSATTFGIIIVGAQWYHWAQDSNCNGQGNCTDTAVGTVTAVDGIIPLSTDTVKESYTATVATSDLSVLSKPLAVGEVVQISEQFDPNYIWYNPTVNNWPQGQCGTGSGATASNVNGYCGWGEDGNDSSLGVNEDLVSRPIGQTNQITKISMNGATTTITFAAPWHHAFRVSHAADIARPGGTQQMLTGIGIEDLTAANGGGGDGGGNIVFWAIANSWMKNIESYNGAPAVHFDGCFRCELRDSYVHTAGNPNPGGGGYGMEIDSYTSDSLFENNISWSFNKVMVMRDDGGGNVIGYNYFEDGYGAGYGGCPSSGTNPQGGQPYTSTCSGIPEAGMNATHMTGTQYALFEGNQSFNISEDDTWGNATYITFFRNQAATLRRNVNNGAGTDNHDGPNCSTFACFGPVVQLSDTMGRFGINVPAHQWWHSYVGNVIGYPNNYLQNPSIGYAYPATFSAVPGTAPGSQEQWYFEWNGIHNNGASPGQDQYEYWTSTLWELGGGNGSSPDAPSTLPGAGGQTVLNTVLRDGNYDYVTNKTHWMGTNNLCNAPGDAACVATNTGNICADPNLCAGQYTTPPAVSALPNSLYIPASMQPPPFFNGGAWPWIDGTNASNPIPGTLPARTRFDAGTPNIVPTNNGGTEPQTITFANPGAQTVGTPLALVATATSTLTVSFTSTTTDICTVSGATATFIAAGTCTIDANQAGNSTYAAAPMVSQSFTVDAAGDSGDPTIGALPSYNDTYANWKNAGLALVGGIPNRTTICATVNPLGGGQDDYTNIQNAIDNCPAGEVVQLGAGAFGIHLADMPIHISTGISLRGTGNCTGASSPYCQTSISVIDGALAYQVDGFSPLCGTSSSTTTDCPNGGQPEILISPVEPDYNYSWEQCGNVGGPLGTGCGATPLAADAVQGQTTIQVTSTTGFTVGSWVLIDEASGAGWQPDPMNQSTGYGSVWAAPDWLSSSGSPASGRVAWAKFDVSVDYEGDFGAASSDIYPYQAGTPGCWHSYCDRPTAELHKIASIGAGPCPGTNCTVTFDDPLTIAFRESGGHNAQLYAKLYGNNSGTGSPISMLEQAGVENISLLRAPEGGLEMELCVNCWVENTEVGDWYGGGIGMAYSARSELNTVYVHHCWDSVNNGGEYPLDMDSASTEMLITNSITNFAGKGMVARSGGAGSVISYNYIDDTMYDDNSGIGDYWLDMSVNASHEVGPHHVLFEGNWGDNLDSDNTHGNSTYITFFRNLGSGLRTPFDDPSIGGTALVDDYTGKGYYCPSGLASCVPNTPGPLRAAGPMAYSYWFAFVGNVLGVSGTTTAANGWTYSGDFSASRIFMLGWMGNNGGQDPNLDGTTGSYVFINGNYDYLHNAVTWKGSPVTLPNSFYLSSKPSFFTSSYPWPWVTPTGSEQVQTGPSGCGGTCSALPAQARWQAGTPFVQP